MDSVVNTVEISGEIGPVFDLVTSARFWPRWHPATQSVGGVTERPYQPGDAIHERGQIAGISFAVTWRVVEHERPARVVIHSQDPAASILYRFESEGDVTRFTREVRYDPAVFATLSARADDLRQLMHLQSEKALAQLKGLVEEMLAAESQPL